ncbi:MAG: hypothetical protein JWP14_2565 [Frankiales bacterium]|nr:hypothetical protein [Frankiales bacterium]
MCKRSCPRGDLNPHAQSQLSPKTAGQRGCGDKRGGACVQIVYRLPRSGRAPLTKNRPFMTGLDDPACEGRPSYTSQDLSGRKILQADNNRHLLAGHKSQA